MKRRVAGLIMAMWIAWLILFPAAFAESGDMTLNDFIKSQSPSQEEPEAESEASDNSGQPAEAAYEDFINQSAYAVEIFQLEEPGYALCDIDADGDRELIFNGKSQIDGVTLYSYYFYDYRGGRVVDAGLIEEELPMLAYSPSRNMVVAQWPAMDWNDSFFYSLKDDVQFEFAVSFVYQSTEDEDDLRSWYVYSRTDADGSSSEITEEEFNSYTEDLEYIEFNSLEYAGEEQSNSVGPFSAEQVDYLRDCFLIPDDVEITDCEFNPDIYEYWDGADAYITELRLLSGNQCIGYSMVDVDTLEPLRMTETFEDMMDYGEIDTSRLVMK